jgi:4-hydroxybenzoate polyprenyltransferase
MTAPDWEDYDLDTDEAAEDPTPSGVVPVWVAIAAFAAGLALGWAVLP